MKEEKLKAMYQYQFDDSNNTVIISSKTQKEVEQYYRTFVTKELLPKRNGSNKMRNKELKQLVTAGFTLMILLLFSACAPTAEERAAAAQAKKTYENRIEHDMSVYSGKVILEKYSEICFPCEVESGTGFYYYFTIPESGSVKKVQVYQGIFEKYSAGDTLR